MGYAWVAAAFGVLLGWNYVWLKKTRKLAERNPPFKVVIPESEPEAPKMRYLTIYSKDVGECMIDNQPFLTETLDEDGKFVWTLPHNKTIVLEPKDGDWLIIRNAPPVS